MFDSSRLNNHTAAKAVLDQQRADYTETEVAHVKLAHRPGELGRVASRLGDAGININYGHCGTEAVTESSPSQIVSNVLLTQI